MLGEDTLLFTKEGFKKLKDLDLYDEVLTAFGDFEPIIEMGPWGECDKKAVISTGEEIYCSDDTLWGVTSNGHEGGSFYYTEDINKRYIVNNIIGNECFDTNMEDEAYNYAVVVPRNVPDKYLLCDTNTKLAFLAGLIDSPICMLGMKDGIYEFYTRYDELARDIVKLIRLLALPLYIRKKEGVYCVSVYMTKYIDVIPIQDELKDCYDYSDTGFNLSINDIKTLKDDKKVRGRQIKVNHGSFLVGYSLIVAS